MLPFVIFAMLWAGGAGIALDQTSPTVHEFGKKLIGESSTTDYPTGGKK